MGRECQVEPARGQGEGDTEIGAGFAHAHATRHVEVDVTGQQVDVAASIEHSEQQEFKEGVERVLTTLTPREEKIIRWRFGIGEDRACTLDQIGRILCLSRERVRQIEAIALRKILASQESRVLYELVG
ncbi:MAG: hypothetical protein IIA30_12710 [Myxococcales bacterium]|nr:hypothetical protein [Myxococcales bacterium]